MSEQMTQLLRERIQLYRDTNDFKKTSRIPRQSSVYGWMFMDSGYSYCDAIHDWGITEKCLLEHCERYQPDGLNYAGARYTMAIAEPVGASHYTYVDNFLNVDDMCVIEDDDFEEFSKDIEKYLWLHGVCKFSKDIDQPDIWERFARSGQECAKAGAFLGGIDQKLREQYGVPKRGKRFVQGPIEYFFNWYRGMKNVGIDMRRRPQQLLDAMQALFETNPGLKKNLEEFYADTSPNEYACYDIVTVLLGHNVMNTKQFEKFYWEPYLKEFIQKSAQLGKRVDIMMEGSLARIADFFADINYRQCDASLNIYVELDDIYEVRKLLPNICLTGGMPTSLLGSGTPEQCRDYAKKLVDELGRDGGYIFAADKMLCYPGDCTRENLLAAYGFVKDYTL